MAIKFTNKAEVDRTFQEFEDRYNKRAVDMMCRLGEKVVKYARKHGKYAREHGTYTDRTANLRNSIGYMVVQNGRIVQTAFTGRTAPTTEGGDANKAHQIGLDYAKEVFSNLSKNKTYLIWVAGMDYAAAVEAKGYDVITGSGNWAESEAQKQMELFKRFLLRNK